MTTVLLKNCIDFHITQRIYLDVLFINLPNQENVSSEWDKWENYDVMTMRGDVQLARASELTGAIVRWRPQNCPSFLTPSPTCHILKRADFVPLISLLGTPSLFSVLRSYMYGPKPCARFRLRGGGGGGISPSVPDTTPREECHLVVSFL